MKLGLCSWSCHKSITSGKMDVPKLFNFCAKELQLGGMDIIAELLPRSDRKSLLEYKKMATDLAITISALSPGNDFGKPSAAERKKQVQTLKKWIDAAYILGTPVLRIFSGWPPRGESKKLWPEMVKCIKECEKSAAAAGVTMAIEPHNDGGFLPTAVESLRLVKEIGSPWVKLNVDTGNYHDPDPYKGIAETMPYAVHMHAKCHHIAQDGRELEFDYDKIFTILKKSAYRGFLNLEFEGQDMHGQDEMVYIPKAVKMLKEMAVKYAF